MMEKAFQPHALPLLHENKLHTLVENRSVFTFQHYELNVFETHRTAEKFRLQFDNLVLTTMLRGRKIMHLFGSEHFDYVPGETVIVPENEEMLIDFPDADKDNPTQCIALTIDHDMVKDTLNLLNEKYPKVEGSESWNIDLNCFHLKNTIGLTDTINRLLHISYEQNAKKDIIADFAVKELCIRLMQTQAKKLILDNYQKHTTANRFAHLVHYIKEHITDNITVEKMSSLCCMSKSNFFKCFKREFGLSPVDYIIQERMKEAKRLLGEGHSISQSAFNSGFNNLSYFMNLFKRNEGITPNDYRKQMLIK